MSNKCSFCGEYKHIFYNDYCPKDKYSPAISINLCLNCAVELHFLREILPKLILIKLCQTCKDYFYFKFKSQAQCGDCYYNG